ncbi:peptidoglycan synthetase FtsI [Fluviicoccus keumensis]|uniref:Peptidoglycan D,D-transpeptidase FtsI n=1 Tax=Fluviicoccus keumensis TaxID=1435465 RepID=A0A4Q7YGC7_9GAMM|nr:penicillin-binding protein 2 [Fluviicoccus keumensis]RZU35369.1 peptidoglycan synthetase FtsI [Fluviicoccus keumensis]
MKNSKASARSPVAADVSFPGRHKVLVWMLGVLFLGMVVRAVYLHVIDRDFLKRQGDARMLRKETLAAHRGMIMDRNGVPLAVSTPVVSLWVNPKDLKELEHPANPRQKPRILDVAELARAIGMEPGALQDKLDRNANKEFFYLKRHLAPDVAQVVLDRGFPGVYGMNEYKRYYPEGESASHIIGFTDLDDHGKEGLELALEQELQGKPGQQLVLRDLKGQKVKDIARVRPAVPGKDIELSFDSRVQYIAYRELAAAVTEHGAKAGIAVALDVETGEVLAMANLPGYNPNNRMGVAVDSLRNRAATDMFEPGSTMKIFTVSAGLESGKYTPSSRFNTNPGTYTVYNKTIRDHENYGVIDMGTIITKSSNVGAAQIALSLPRETLPTFFDRFGFGRVTGSGFPGESRGRIQPPERWNPVEIATMSYGYGITVTALQLAHAYATVAAGGIERPVSFKKVGGVVPGKRILSEKIAAELLPMMESVVSSDGTALKAAIPGYRVAGKTGTAHKATGGGYAANDYMSLFVGVAPVSHPKVVMAVIIDNPTKGSYYGGLVAAPVFSKVMAEALRLMNVPTDKPLEPPPPVPAERSLPSDLPPVRGKT